MKKEFQVGDRVRVYDAGGANGIYTGKVTRVFERILDVNLGEHPATGDEHVLNFYKKQCRRLVKKQRRESWVCLSNGGTTFLSYTKPSDYHGYSEVIHVREVREKK